MLQCFEGFRGPEGLRHEDDGGVGISGSDDIDG